MKLHFREYGSGRPMVVLHGLFGSSDNWLTQAKLLSDSFHVYTPDLRNHGLSPHDEAFDYRSMVDDLKVFFDERGLDPCILVGHSMGGKAAMNFALSYPNLVEKLVVVDIAPRLYDLEHYIIADGLAAIPIETISSRNEADEALAPYVSDPGTRQFLLKNLQRKAEGGFTWKINLPVIRAKLKNVGEDLFAEGSFTKPVLFVRGEYSSYILDSDTARIKQVFPSAAIRSIATGHWVQAEKPQEFVDLLRSWIDETETP